MRWVDGHSVVLSKSQADFDLYLSLRHRPIGLRNSGIDSPALRHVCKSTIGWVLVTLMTAGLVVLIWAVAGPALTSLFEQAIQRVSGL
jgi:hypothetical protein